MRVEDFPRPANDNRRGVHWSASVYHPIGAALDFWIGELQAMNIKWLKLMDDGGGSSLELCKRLLASGMMPIVRLYRLEPNPGHIGAREAETVRRLVAEGVRYFETNNEPNLSAEWKGGRLPANWLDLVVDDFIYDADKIIGLGGLPGFPALGVGARDDPFELVVQRGRADLFDNGAWVALHNYTLNHPLDYPYDPVNQEGVPLSQEEYNRLGPWAWEGRSREQINAWRASDKQPGATLRDDTACFLSFALLDEVLFTTLGRRVPILSTEGGPVVGWKDDRRYPRIDPVTHAAWVTGINDFMQGGREIHGVRCPDNYFTLCHWLLANYRLGFVAPGWESQCWYSDWWNDEFRLTGELLAVAAVKAMPASPIDLDGRFAFEGLPAGRNRLALGESMLPGLELTGENSVQLAAVDLAQGRRSLVRGRVADGAGRPQSDVLVTLSRESLIVAQASTTADGVYHFVNLPAGAYRLEAAGMGVVADGIALDGQREYVADVLWVGPGPRSMVQGRVLTAGGSAAGDVLVRLLHDNVEVRRAQTDAGGAFRFQGLAGGVYALAVGEGAPLVSDIRVDEDATVTRELILPPSPAKLLASYLLFGPRAPDTPASAEARLALSLATDYLIHFGAAGGFSVDEAAQARQVIIVGDAVPAAVEGPLRAAGCQVTRLAGDGFALAEAFKRLATTGSEGVGGEVTR